MNRHHENTDENAYTRQDEEALYEIAAAEIAVRRVKKGLWAKAYAQCEGDPNRTKALYIKLRVQALKDEAAHNARQAAPAAEECAQAENALVVQGNSEEPFQDAPWGQIFDGEMHEKKLDASDTGAKSVAADRAPETKSQATKRKVTAMPEEWQDQSGSFLGGKAHPWRRFFARFLDYIVLTFVLYNVMPEQKFDRVVESPFWFFILPVLWRPAETLFISLFGATPGKWLFGIRVVHPDGKLLSFWEAFKRSFMIFWHGEGFNIPILGFFANLFSFSRLTKTGTTIWDAATNAVVTHKKWNAVRIALIIGMLFFILDSLHEPSQFQSKQDATQGSAQINTRTDVRQLFEKASKGDAQARQALEKAAAQGDADAQFGLGVMYSLGQGVPQDYAQARQWLEKAAAQGLAWAQAVLGEMYANGQGVPQDYAQARQWYEKAAAQGNAVAQFGLGAMYYDGQGVRQDYAQARQWFEKAAAQGDADAQFNLGAMYYNGDGVQQDKRAAKAWYDKACEAGNQDGCDASRELNEAGF